jgi:hypothetical protein
MRRAALFVVLTGLVLAPVWDAPPAEACENCLCQGEGTGQVSQVIQTLTGVGSTPQAAGAVVKSDRSMTTVGKLAQAVTQRLGASHMFGISMPVYWR